MADVQLSSLTVPELRRIAKEHGIPLKSSMNKAQVIACLSDALSEIQGETVETQPAEQANRESARISQEPVVKDEPVDSDDIQGEADNDEAVNEQDASDDASNNVSQPKFRAAWHNPGSRYGNQRTTYGARPGFGPAAHQDSYNRTAFGGTRPINTGAPRFGPAAVTEPASESRSSNDISSTASSWLTEQQERAGTPQRWNSDPELLGSNSQQQSPSGGISVHRTGFTTGARNWQVRSSQHSVQTQHEQPVQISLDPEVLLAPVVMVDAEGVLEIHPEGYGFLRVREMLPSGKDYYVPAGLIKRFELRAGDLIQGQARPQREGERYGALLNVTTINQVSAEDSKQRLSYDDLTPVYPSRRIQLGGKANDIRLVDLIAPLGFGQRALLLCPPESGKSLLLSSLANTIHQNHPDAVVLVVLLDEAPENVTLFKDRTQCQVFATTFDQPPENSLRLGDLVLERAERLVEQQRDVVLMIDSLTRLSKSYTTASAQQGRSIPGMINPASLHRTKKLFGAARAVREGGSLTVIGTMSVEGNMRMDDTIVEEFKGAANMIITLDAVTARAGVYPPINLAQSGTRKAELLLTDAQRESLRLLRANYAGISGINAVPQLLQIISNTATNNELLEKLPNWIAMMKGK